MQDQLHWPHNLGTNRINKSNINSFYTNQSISWDSQICNSIAHLHQLYTTFAVIIA